MYLWSIFKIIGVVYKIIILIITPSIYCCILYIDVPRLFKGMFKLAKLKTSFKPSKCKKNPMAPTYVQMIPRFSRTSYSVLLLPPFLSDKSVVHGVTCREIEKQQLLWSVAVQWMRLITPPLNPSPKLLPFQHSSTTRLRPFPSGEGRKKDGKVMERFLESYWLFLNLATPPTTFPNVQI